jgi:signal transduction histidine kinase
MFGAKDESEFTSFGSWDLSPDLQPDGQSSADKAREMIDKALRDGSFLFEWTHRRLGGEEFPATVLLTRMEIGGETVVKASVRDITEHKRLEDKLRDAVKYAQDIINTGREPLVVLDDKFRVISANRSFYSTFDVTPEMSENILLFDLGNGQWEIPRLRELLVEVLPKSTSIEDFEVEHDFPTIGQKTMLINARRIQSETGATQMILLAIEDITERKRVEDKLKNTSEYAQNIVSTVREPLVVLDDKFRVISANRSFYSTFKVTTEMSENTLLFDLGDGQWEIPKLRELLEKVLPKSTTIEDFEVEHDFPDIGQKTMLMNARRIQSETGATQMILLAIEDITERKAVEEKVSLLNTELRVHVDALESLYEELDSFSYSISHDLRAPLRAIEGFSAMLIEDHRESLDDEGRRLLGVVSAQTQKMGELIDGLLQFSRTSREDLALGPVDMRALCGEVIAECESRTGDRDVTFNVEELPPAVGDYRMLKQVFENLIGNAVKFTGTRKKAVIDVGFQQEEGNGTYFVRDNGVGFDMEYADNIFGVFQRYHSEKEFEGTGIGLSLVQRIVTKHGGRVWAEAEEGRGATFYFTLPRLEEG